MNTETNEIRKRGYLFYFQRIIKWFGIILLLLIVLGVVYQTIASEVDKNNFSPRGQLYTVNGHQMHLVCMGEGNPTVILQAGNVAESLWWYWVQNQVAEHTRVCAYDRPGLGWSEPGSEHDSLTIIHELHDLLEEAGIAPPYVIAGHSFGGIWSRIFAAEYPEDVIGLVLVDTTFVVPRNFANQAEFDEWKSANDAIQAPLSAFVHLGVNRLIGGGAFAEAGYPVEIIPEMVALQSRNQTFYTSYEETVANRWQVSEASANAENLGALPMVVLWAEPSGLFANDEALQNYYAERDTIANYSSNSMVVNVAGANHGSILGNKEHAGYVTDAILAVIEADQTGLSLTK